MYIRFHMLKTKDYQADQSKAKNELDLRPSIIAKLQQLVKDGSNGLYVLSMQTIEPDIATSKVDISNATIKIDSIRMKKLDSLRILPDDIFELKFPYIHIDGMGIEDLLSSKKVDLKGIFCTKPEVIMYHKKQSYNSAKREHNDQLSLYEKLKGNFHSINIGKFKIENGTFIHHNFSNSSTNKFNEIGIVLQNILIDSSTQNDRNRFLYADKANIESKNFKYPTPDSLYYLKLGNILLSGDKHNISLTNVELIPRFNRIKFEKKLRFRKEMYNILFNKISIKDIDWWAALNLEEIIADEAVVTGGTINVYIDKTLPSVAAKINNFPQQWIRRIHLPIGLGKLNIDKVNIEYEEYNPKTRQSAIVYFDKLKAQASNITNITSRINKQPNITLNAQVMFMHKTKMSGLFLLNQAKQQTGDFKGDLEMQALDNSTVNPITEPLQLFTVKRGMMQSAHAHVEGNNNTIRGYSTMLYNDLHITPLKADNNSEVRFKKKSMTSLIANIFLIKNANPIKGSSVRSPHFQVNRDSKSNLISFIWSSLVNGLLQSVGIPPRLAVDHD